MKQKQKQVFKIIKEYRQKKAGIKRTKKSPKEIQVRIISTRSKTIDNINSQKSSDRDGGQYHKVQTGYSLNPENEEQQLLSANQQADKGDVSLEAIPYYGNEEELDHESFFQLSEKALRKSSFFEN